MTAVPVRGRRRRRLSRPALLGGAGAGPRGHAPGRRLGTRGQAAPSGVTRPLHQAAPVAGDPTPSQLLARAMRALGTRAAVAGRRGRTQERSLALQRPPRSSGSGARGCPALGKWGTGRPAPAPPPPIGPGSLAPAWPQGRGWTGQGKKHPPSVTGPRAPARGRSDRSRTPSRQNHCGARAAPAGVRRGPLRGPPPNPTPCPTDAAPDPYSVYAACPSQRP